MVSQISRASRLEAKIPRRLLDSLFPDDGPSRFWSMARINPTYTSRSRNLMFILAKLLSFQYPTECNRCNCVVDNQIVHKVFYCANSENMRTRLWQEALGALGVKYFSLFIQQPATQQLLYILSDFVRYTETDSDSSFSGGTHGNCLKLLLGLCV